MAKPAFTPSRSAWFWGPASSLWLIMLVIAGGMMIYFRRKQWLGGEN